MPDDVHLGRAEQTHRHAGRERDQRGRRNAGDHDLHQMERPACRVLQALSRIASAARSTNSHAPTSTVLGRLARLMPKPSNTPSSHRERHAGYTRQHQRNTEHDQHHAPVQHGRTEARPADEQRPAIVGKRQVQRDVVGAARQFDRRSYGSVRSTAVGASQAISMCLFARYDRQRQRAGGCRYRLRLAVDRDGQNLRVVGKTHGKLPPWLLSNSSASVVRRARAPGTSVTSTRSTVTVSPGIGTGRVKRTCSVSPSSG